MHSRPGQPEKVWEEMQALLLELEVGLERKDEQGQGGALRMYDTSEVMSPLLPALSPTKKKPTESIEADTKKTWILKWPAGGRLLLGWDTRLGFALVGDEQSGKATKPQRLAQHLVCFDWYREKVVATQKPHPLRIQEQWETDDGSVSLLGLWKSVDSQLKAPKATKP